MPSTFRPPSNEQFDPHKLEVRMTACLSAGTRQSLMCTAELGLSQDRPIQRYLEEVT